MSGLNGTVIALAKTCVGAIIIVCALVNVGTVGNTGPAPFVTTASQSQSPSIVPGYDLNLRLIFYGYPKIGVPQCGTAVISATGLSDIRDVTFTRTGGEFSPNGRFIAFDNCGGADRGIYLAEPDGSKPQLIKRLDNYCADIRWSPNSAQLSYVSGTERNLRILDIASGTDRLVPNTQGAGWHWWSPAGNEIVYERTPRRNNVPAGRLLFITDLTGNSRQLTFAQDFVPCDRYTERNFIDTWAPAWSPKGDKIAFTQCGVLFIVSPSGKDLRQLTRTPTGAPETLPITDAYSPRWSPDGLWIIFTGEIPCRISEGPPLKRISPDDKKVVDFGRLPYCGGPFSIAPLN